MLVENFPNVIKPSKQFYYDAFDSEKDINYSPNVKKTKYTLNEIHGKTQEILRKSKINLPYHVPPKLTLSQLENGEINTLDDQDIKIFDSFKCLHKDITFKKISHTTKTYIDYVESSDEEALFTTSPYLPIKSNTKPADKNKNNFVKKRLDFSNFLSRDASKLINSEMLKFENNVCDDITSSKYVTIVSDKNPRNIIRPTNLNSDTNFRSFQNRFTLHASYKTPQVKKNLNPEKRSNEKITKNLLQKGHEKINNKLKLNEIKDFNTLQDSLLPILKQKRIVALQQRQKAYENYNKKNKKSRHNNEEIDVEESIMEPENDVVLESQDCFVENNFDKNDYGRKLEKENINSLEMMSVVNSERQSSALGSIDLFKSSQSTPLIINIATSSNNIDKENTTLGQEETACDALDWGAYFSRCLTTQKNLNNGISIENDPNSATTATAKILKFDFSHVKTPEKSEVDCESQTLRIEEIRRNVNKLFGIQSPSKQHETEHIGDNQALEIVDDFSNSCSIVSQQQQETQTQIEENVKTFENASNILNRINNPFENKNNGKEMLDFSLQNTQHNLSMLGQLLTPIGPLTLSPDRPPMLINQKSPSLNNSSFTDDENLDSNVSTLVVNENNGQPKMKKTIILSSDDEDLDGIKPLTKVQKPKIFSKKISSDTETTNIFWNENDDKNNAKDLPIDTTFDCDNVSKNSDDDDIDSDIEQNEYQASNISNSKRQQSLAKDKSQNSDTSVDEIESDNSSQNEHEGTSLKDEGYRDEEDEFLEYVKRRPEKIELNEYIDEEAELSGSDVGKDEIENDDDDYEIDVEAENFNMDETELKDELGRIHRKVTLDQDKREIRALQEIFFDDPDDPENVKNIRVKRFKWNFDEVTEKNSGDIGKNTNNKLFSDDEEEADESLQIANGKHVSGDHTDKNNTSFDCHQNAPLKLKMQLMPKLPFANTMENAMGIDVENSAGNNACTVKETTAAALPLYKTENEDDISNEMTRMKFRFEREQLMANVTDGTTTKQTNETTIGVNHFKQLGLSKTKEIKTPFNIIKRQSALATLNNVKEKIIQKMPSFNISATSNSLLFSDSSSKIVKHLNEDSNSLGYGNASTSKLSNENFIFKKLSPSIKLGKHITSTKSVKSAMPTTSKHTKRSIMKNSIFKYF